MLKSEQVVLIVEVSHELLVNLVLPFGHEKGILADVLLLYECTGAIWVVLLGYRKVVGLGQKGI